MPIPWKFIGNGMDGNTEKHNRGSGGIFPECHDLENYKTSCSDEYPTPRYHCT